MKTITVPDLGNLTQQVGVPDGNLVLSGQTYEELQGAAYVTLSPPIEVEGTAVPEAPIIATYENHVLAKVLGRDTQPAATSAGVISIPTPEGLVVCDCPGTELQFVIVEAVEA